MAQGSTRVRLENGSWSRRSGDPALGTGPRASMRATAAACLAALLLSLGARGQPENEYIEVDFDPMDGGPDDIPEIVLTQPKAPSPGAGVGMVVPEGGPPHNGGLEKQRQEALQRENDLDRAIGAMLGNIAAVAGNGGRAPPSGQVAPRAPGRAAPEAPANMGSGRSSMSIQDIQSLFPGPLIVEEGGGSPDPVVQDIIQSMRGSFRQDMIPAIHQAGGGRSPPSCSADLQKHCATATSPLHCLGRHTNDISDACRQDVGKSVPFVCSQSIDRFCDILQQGILACLSGHMQDLEPLCQDSVKATQKVVAKVNTQKASLVNKKTGSKKVSTPPLDASLPSSLSDRERDLDAKLMGLVGGAGLSEKELDAQLAKVAGEVESRALRSEQAARSALNKMPAADEQYSVTTVLMAPVLLACVVWAFAFTDLPQELLRYLKPFLEEGGGGRQPLRGGVQHGPVCL
mmetsp:Transcript_20181/g.44523  ORF Transcript_20181/g.44523 Transcript_20181/m.44523 type:complete len:459 (+) Transcript_20181:3-1379(+)